MQLILRLCSAILIMSGAARLDAQDTLLSEDFNNCTLSPAWQVQSTGNPVITWYVGLAQNDLVPGQSIDSSCFLFIDDYSTGVGTPGYVLNFRSPAFDVTPYSTVMCSMDVHFRFGETDYLEILATDGVKESLLARFDNNRTNGKTVKEHFSLQHDLSLVSQSANTRIIIRYTSPTGSEGHYAGIDNIRIVGSGSGTNVIREAFNDCAKPAGWTTEMLTGPNDWKFGRIPFGSSAFFDGNSMDGSCFVYFDDAALGETAPGATIRLNSPWFDGTDYFQFALDFDMILRYSGNEKMTVYLQTAPGAEQVLYESPGHVAGPFFPNYKHFSVDLTPYRSPQMRIVFEYADGNSWGYWAGIDNVKVTGNGQAFDFCSQAMTLLTGAPCSPANNSTALFDGPAASCSGRTTAGLWYRWQADFSGVAKLTTQAAFNDVVSIFSGTCVSPVPEVCDNHDEHGFTGETTYFTVQTGKQYFIRVSGLDEGFGVPRGDLCVKIEQVASNLTRPNNDNCANAVNLVVNTACTNGSNVNALTSTTLPSLNQLARADVWYRFTAGNLPAGEQYEVRSNATFSDIITVYKGGCSTLQEVAGNHNGGVLELPALTNGQTYYVQVAGNFATVEGPLCVQVATKLQTAPPNDDCLSAISLPLGGKCVAGSNLGATFSGRQPSCAVVANRDIWFKFVAPAFGSVQINTGADFDHSLAVWQGDCNNLQQIFCTANPLRCNGYVTVGSLNAGQTYYLQIASRTGPAGAGSGDVCVRIVDGNVPSGFEPVSLSVKETCIGMDTAMLFVKVSGGVPPLTFPGHAPGQILLSGTPYTVVVVDSTGCETYVSGIVAPCASNVCTQEITLNLTPPTCFGENDGAIQTTLTGGTGPFQFNWSNGIFTANNAGLAAGSYTLSVVDANGCESVETQIVPQPDSVRILEDSIIYPTQGKSNGAINITVSGGTPPYEFVWLVNGNPYSTGTEDLSDLRKGFYLLTVTDSNGCQGVLTVNLPETVGTKYRVAPYFAVVIPNPARDKAVLSVQFTMPQTIHLAVTDAVGRTLQDWTVENVQDGQIPLDLRNLPDGVYFLQVQGGQEKFARKLVVGH